MSVETRSVEAGSTELVKLNRSELSELTKHEQTIRDGLHTFVEVGNALLNIRDKRLYRADHDSFETYCRQKWGMSKTHANRLIASSAVVTNVQRAGGVSPINEAQVRPLTKLDPEIQKKVWGQIVKKTHIPGDITSGMVREIIEKVTGKSAVGKRNGYESVRREEPVTRSRVLDELNTWWSKNSARFHRSKPEEVFIAVKKIVGHGL